MTEKDEETTSSNGEVEAWGTFEELLLVSAVNRHGPHRWDSISSELLKRCRFHHNDDDSTHSFSAKNCRRKYLDLKRRFSAAAAGDKFSGDVEEEEEENGVLRMVEELRKVRVEELKREVHKHDVSIVSLQMKVKELEDERENNNSSKPDAQLQQLPSDLRIEPDHKTSGEPERSKQLGVDSAEDRSVNESNSAPKREPEEDKAEPDQQPKREGVNNSNNNIISNSNDNMKIKNNNNNNNMKEQSSDVQSSASLSKKKRRRVRGGGINSSGDELEAEEISPANKKINLKSQPLIRFLDSLRSHKHGSVFHRRLPSQETEKYRNVVRQHMDLDTVQSRLDRGIYSECHPKFYRDLLLIFTNGVLFYRKSTAEHIAARELRKLVLEEVVLRTQKPKTHSLKPDSEPHLLEPIVKKPRSSTTMVVCRRRNPSSIQALSENMKKDQDLNNVNRIGAIKHDSGSKVANGRDEKSNASTLHLKKVDSSSKNVNAFACKEEKEGDKGVGVVNSKKLPSKERSSLGVGAVGLSSNNSKKIIKKEGSNKEKLGNNKEENSNSEGEKAEKIERKKIVNEQNQKQEKGTPILKKPGVANFLERMKQNSPEKTKKDEEEDEDEAEELKRRGKIDGDSRNHGKKGGGGSKRNNVNNRDVEASVTRRTSGRREEKEATASGRSTGRPPKRKAAMMGGNTPDSARGGRSGGRDGGEKSKKKPRR